MTEINRDDQAKRALGTLMVGFHDLLCALRMSSYTGENRAAHPIAPTTLVRVERLLEEAERLIENAHRFAGRCREQEET